MSKASPFGVGGFLAIMAMERARGVLVLYHESGELVLTGKDVIFMITTKLLMGAVSR